MKPFIRDKSFLFFASLSLLFLSIFFSLSTGAVSIPMDALFLGKLNHQQEVILFSIRLPRVLLSLLIGSSLAISGATMQALFRNPLADPALIGVSSGAAFAVALAIVVFNPFVGIAGLYGLSLFAFMGGICTCFLIFRFSQMNGAFSVTYMLLAGIAINALCGGGTGFLTYLSDDQELRSFTFWTMGNLGGALWSSVIVMFSIFIPNVIILIKNARKMNLLLLGEQDANHLGLDTEKFKRITILCTVLLVSVAVSVSGVIGFIGLIVPHFVRLLLGADYRLLIPFSALFGALLLLVADTFARTLVSPTEMPVGILTSFLGGPFFLWLLSREYGKKFGI